jgi:hypothetical protein
LYAPLDEDDRVLILPRDTGDRESENIRLIGHKNGIRSVDRNSSPDIPPTLRHIAAPDRITKW